MNEKFDILKEIIQKSENIVFFGGAGVSTESGIPDFRSEDGIYNTKYKYPPEIILSHTFFLEHPDEFYKFYRDKMLYDNTEPNNAHYAISELEKQNKLKAIITQNIDGLHQKAGSKNVIELHGTVMKNHCMKCGRFHTKEDISKSEGIPRCHCGGIIKPDVVLYEEGLDNRLINDAVNYIYGADVLIVAGTSLKVYPAAGLIDYYKGNKLILINNSETSKDENADLVIREKVGETLHYCVQE